jgi:hypothetical protein
MTARPALLDNDPLPDDLWTAAGTSGTARARLALANAGKPWHKMLLGMRGVGARTTPPKELPAVLLAAASIRCMCVRPKADDTMPYVSRMRSPWKTT